MSQDKVDRYKQNKSNRKKEMKKQKRKELCYKGLVAAIAIAVVGWLGYSVWDTYQGNKDRDVAEVNYDAISDYMNGLQAE